MSRALKGGQWSDVHHIKLEAGSLSKPLPAEYAFRNKQLNQRVRGKPTASFSTVLSMSCACRVPAPHRRARADQLGRRQQQGARMDIMLNHRWAHLDHRVQLVSMFGGLVDMDHIATCGHSFGAATAVSTATADPRVKAVVALDMWIIPFDKPLRAPAQPVLEHQSTVFKDTPEYAEPKTELFALSNEASRLFTLHESGHLNYCDFAWHSPIVTRLLKDTGAIDHNLALRVVSAHMLSFVNEHLNLGQGLPRIDGLVDASLMTVHDIHASK